MVAWLIKEELSNRKLSSLQALIDEVMPLKDSGHCSSTAVGKMIPLSSAVVTEKIVGEITKCHLWPTMVDQASDIPTFQHYITVHCSICGEGWKLIQVNFLDFIKVDWSGATANNLFAMFKSVSAEYQLDMRKHVAAATDALANMTMRVRQFFGVKVEAEIWTMVSVHCHAHACLALACCDTAANLCAILKCVSTLLQLWKSFYCIASLAMHQTTKKVKGRRLQRACKIRWLSSEGAVRAARSEILVIWTHCSSCQKHQMMQCALVYCDLWKQKNSSRPFAFCQLSTSRNWVKSFRRDVLTLHIRNIP